MGNLNISGNYTRLNTDNIIVDDPLIVLGLDSTNNVVQSGFVSRYMDGANYKFTGLVKETNSYDYHLFKEIDPLATDNEIPKSLDMTDNLSNKDKHGSIVVNKIDSLDETDLVPASMSYTQKSNASIFTEGSLGVANNVFIGENKGIYFGSSTTKIEKTSTDLNIHSDRTLNILTSNTQDII